jgi:hypothetical protein
MIRKRTVTQAVPAALIAPLVLAAAIAVLAMVLFAGCSSPYSSPNWPYGSGGGHTPGGGLNPLSMDTTPPGVVTHLAALTGSGTVAFTWLDPADDDLDHVEIWAGTSASNGTVVGSISKGKQTYTGTGAAGAELYYHFITVDKSGNRSAAVNYMVKLEVIVADVTNLVGIITGVDSVRLSWTDPAGPAFYQADITHDGGGGPVYVPKGTEQSAWNGLSSGTTYQFTVKAINGGSSGGVSVSMTLTQDTTPPGPVTGLGAIDGGFGSVDLNWTNPGDTDVQYVEIICDPLSGPAQTINATPGAAGTYTWNGLAGGVTYTFTLKAVDHSGNRSEGRTVTGTPLDMTPPGPVTGLQGISGDASVVLTWTDPGEADLAYVQIECDEIPGPARTVNAGTGTYTWSGLTKGASYTFTVTTRDTSGNLNVAAVSVGPVPVILAGGGTISFAKVEGDPSKIWEIHTFTASGALTFPSGYTSVTADYLIVAGGGGSGGDQNNNIDSDFAGGGGAGGLRYATGAALIPQGGVVQITVGAGGAGGQKQTQGTDGEPSAIGTIEVPGGGGGGGAYGNMTGRPGGSGGGGGAGNKSGHGNGGARSSGDTDILGNRGGNGSGGSGSNSNSGGGGGGARGQGTDSPGSSNNALAGGAPWDAAVEGASWLVDATGTAAFSRGGNGGGTNAPQGGKAGVNYGDGGSSGNNRQQLGGAGHSGVVVIRFQRD